MAASILLLDCTDELAKRLRALGHEVHVGTALLYRQFEERVDAVHVTPPAVRR